MPEMRKKAAAAAFAAVFLLAGNAIAAARYFSAVEFRGLNRLTKADIIRGVRLGARGKGVVIDMDSLEKSLGSFAIIQNYDIDEKNGRLVLSITERDPRFIIAYHGNSQTVVFEIDASFRPIAFNRLYCPWLPVIHIGGQSMKGGRITGEVESLCRMFENARKAYPAIFREIREIYLRENSLEVLLAGRRTHFILGVSEADFRRLKYIAGYIDSSGAYPERITINDDKVLIRKGV